VLAAPAPPTVDARSWALIDAADGDRLASRDPDRESAIASTTKLMTAYLALRDLRPRQRLTAPPYTAEPGEAVLGLEAGERDTVHDLLYGMLLPSGGDAAVTLADGVAGSIPAFVERMNTAAAALGLLGTHYSTPVGVDTPGNYSTADDLTTLARTLLRNPRFAKIVSTGRKTLRSGAETRTVLNRNDLVLRYPWVVGVKTGYTIDARYVLVAAGREHGVTLISAVLGAPSEYARDADSLDLLRYGFSLYRPREAVSATEPLAHPRINDVGGRLPLLAAHDVKLWARPGQRPSVAVHAPRAVNAPVRRGRRIGTAIVRGGSGATRSVPLVAAHSVPPPGVPAGIAAALPGAPSEAAAAILGAIALGAGLALAVLAMTAPRTGRLLDRRRGPE
jgi:D-alanyl-D-alanine carboxypeptidase (penicillin-binding protein 5/6)